MLGAKGEKKIIKVLRIYRKETVITYTFLMILCFSKLDLEH